MMRRPETPRIRPRVRVPMSGPSTKPELPHPPKRSDIILQRLAWLSQIALVFAAILGYIFTVRPVHQKHLLDEQIAARTISLQAATTTLENLQSEAARLRTENSKLGTEARETYEQLRSNISLELISIPDACAVRPSITPRNSNEIPACAMNFAKVRIAPSLRPDDRAILFETIERHSTQMIASNANVTKRFAAKARQLDNNLKKAKSDLENADPEVRAEILKLRIARAGGKTVEPDPPTGRIIVREEEDRTAYDNYATRHAQLNDRVFDLTREKIFFDSDLALAYRDALAKISSEILEEFRNKTRKR